MVSEEFVYWSYIPIPENPIKILNGIYYLLPRDAHPDEGRAIQATAYGLLVYLRNNKFEESIPIMKFLQTQRNTDSGFASTQASG